MERRKGDRRGSSKEKKFFLWKYFILMHIILHDKHFKSDTRHQGLDGLFSKQPGLHLMLSLQVRAPDVEPVLLTIHTNGPSVEMMPSHETTYSGTFWGNQRGREQPHLSSTSN